MPLLKIVTSATPSAPAQAEILGELSRLLAGWLTKPEKYVMTALLPGVAMTMAGSSEPAAYVELKNVGDFRPEQTRTLSGELCARLAKALGVAPERIYVEFTPAEGYLWGHAGDTFG